MRTAIIHSTSAAPETWEAVLVPTGEVISDLRPERGWYLIVVGLFLLGVGAQAQEPIPTLDLTKPLWCEDQLPTTISGIVVGTGGGLIHGPPPPRLPLDLRLVDIEPLPLRVGGKVTYEVELENVGAAPFLIPWGTICDVTWNDPNTLKAGVSLILDEYPESGSFAYELAYGMMNDPRTTRSLAPGEKMRIRLSDVFNLSTSNTPDRVKKLLEYQEKAVIDVRGSIYLRGKPYRKYFLPERKSSNVVAVEVTPLIETLEPGSPFPRRHHGIGSIYLRGKPYRKSR